MKQCTKCGCVKPFEAFYRSTPAKPGQAKHPEYRPQCIECVKAAQRTRPKKLRDPAKKEEYARRRGERSCNYVPKAERHAAAASRLADCKAHVQAWARHNAKPVLHDEHVRLYRSPELHSLRWARRYRTDEAFALKQRLRTQGRKKAKLCPKLEDNVRYALRSLGSSATAEKFLGYTIADLRAHIERQFTKGMDWQAFAAGLIHIDHITPQRCFDLSDLDEVRACWALPNLRPMWAVENLRKGGRVVALA